MKNLDFLKRRGLARNVCVFLIEMQNALRYN